jgi:Predicted membrane protein
MQYLVGLQVRDPDEVRTIFLVFWMIFEPLRLLAGFHGNLQEKVRVLTLLCMYSAS